MTNIKFGRTGFYVKDSNSRYKITYIKFSRTSFYAKDSKVYPSELLSVQDQTSKLTLRCLKYIKGIFSPYAVWHSYFSIPRQSFYIKRVKSLEETFSSSENAIWSILLKYQKK